LITLIKEAKQKKNKTQETNLLPGQNRTATEKQLHRVHYLAKSNDPYMDGKIFEPSTTFMKKPRSENVGKGSV
jgi:hypothetical protein